MRLLPLTLLALALACSGDKDEGTTPTGDGGSVGDGGSTVGDGCVELDGVLGYERINDAIAAAQAGSVIRLDACPAGAFIEDVLIDKAITLSGPSSVSLEPDFEDEAVRIQSDGVTVQGLGFTYGKAGILVEGSVDVRLEGLLFDGVSQWAVKASDSRNLLLTDLRIRNVGKGGVSIEGGSATIEGLDLADSKGSGVKASGGAVVEVRGSTIGDISGEGFGLRAEDASFLTEGNALEGVRYPVYAEGGSFDMDGDEITGGLFGILLNEASLSARGLSVRDATDCGVYVYSPDGPISLEDSLVVGTEGVVTEISASTWESTPYRGAGLFLLSPDTTLSGVEVQGYSGVGAFIYDESGGKATLRDVTLSGQGNHGLYLSNVDAEATDVTVSDLRVMSTTPDERCYTVDSDVGVVVFGRSLKWTRGSVTDIEGYGISAISANLTVDGASFARTHCASVLSFQSTARITYSDFREARGDFLASSVAAYEGESLYVGGSSFQDNRSSEINHIEEFSSGGVTYRYEYSSDVGSDVQVWVSGTAELVMNTHQGGVNGVELHPYGSTAPSATLRDSTFTDYSGMIAYLKSGTSLSMTDTTIDGHGTYGLACQGGQLTLNRVQIQNGGSTSSWTTTYVDGRESASLESTAVGPSILAGSCAMSAQDLTVADAQGNGMSLSDSSFELRDVTVRRTGLSGSGHGIELGATSTPLNVYVDGLLIEGVSNGSGLYGSTRAASTLTLYDVDIASTGAWGLSLSHAGSGSTASVQGADIRVSGAAGASGVLLSGYTANLSRLSATGNSGNGIELSAGTTALSASESQDNGGYGLVCSSSAVLTSCDVARDGNTLGGQSGCDAWCD